MIWRIMFQENHQRYLFAQFHSIDKLFSEALAELRPAEDGRLFATHVPDATASQRQVLSDYVAQLRFLLRRFLQVQDFTDKRQPVSALWSFRVAISFAGTAVEELRPKYLRGYGDLDAVTTTAAERLAADLKSLLGRMASYLERGEGAGIGERLALLDATVNEIELLAELDRVIAAYGLIELRAPLEQLVERAASPRFEVAIFGRVNSGKTSLLNWWLGQPLLPTGVTPMTAVPTRILHGDIPQARVTTTGAAPFDVPMDQLRAYITEDDNPANSKGVLDIEIRVPALRLVDGLCLVDTPGLGSLATVGAAQTLEYLPRCDLGVLLIEAGGVIGREDLDVARAILDGGSELIIALSKADRLSGEELPLALQYARAHLNAELRSNFDVRAISTLPTHLSLADAWFQREFAPRLATHREQARRALRRKTGVLRETVIALLDARLASNTHKQSGRGNARSDPASRLPNLASDARIEIDRQRRSLHSIGLSDAEIDRITDSASEALTQAWIVPLSDVARAGAQVKEAIVNLTTEAADELSDSLRQLRVQLQHSLDALTLDSASPMELPSPRGRPLLDTAAISLPSNLERPRGLSSLRPLMRAEAQKRIEQQTRTSLKAQLAIYVGALRHWAGEYLNDLAAQFDEALGPREGSERIAADGAVSDDRVAALKNDLERLRQWSKDRVQSLEG
jgi:GTP-binding protein EngB required for normal cell division